MAACGPPPPPPPPTPIGLYKLSGIYPPDEKPPDPALPQVAFAENIDKGWVLNIQITSTGKQF